MATVHLDTLGFEVPEPLPQPYSRRCAENAECVWAEHVRQHEAAAAGGGKCALLAASGECLKLVAQFGAPPSRRAALWRHWAGGLPLDAMSGSAEAAFGSALGARLPEEQRKQLEIDLPRTLPSHPLCRSAAGQAKLRRVMTAFINLNPQLGYVQGMSFLAAFAVLVCDDEPSALAVICCVSRVMRGYFTPTLEGLAEDMGVLRLLLREDMPLLDARLRAMDCCVDSISSRWLLTAFVGCLPSEGCVRVWDALLFNAYAARSGTMVCRPRRPPEARRRSIPDLALQFFGQHPGSPAVHSGGLASPARSAAKEKARRGSLPDISSPAFARPNNALGDDAVGPSLGSPCGTLRAAATNSAAAVAEAERGNDGEFQAVGVLFQVSMGLLRHRADSLLGMTEDAFDTASAAIGKIATVGHGEVAQVLSFSFDSSARWAHLCGNVTALRAGAAQPQGSGSRRPTGGTGGTGFVSAAFSAAFSSRKRARKMALLQAGVLAATPAPSRPSASSGAASAVTPLRLSLHASGGPSSATAVTTAAAPLQSTPLSVRTSSFANALRATFTPSAPTIPEKDSLNAELGPGLSVKIRTFSTDFTVLVADDRAARRSGLRDGQRAKRRHEDR